MNIFRDMTMAPSSHRSGIFVRSTGHFFIVKAEPEKFADFAEIFWCINGSATFYDSQNHQHTLKKDQLWYYPPDSHHNFIPDPKGFDYYWLAFEGKGAAVIFEALGFISGINAAGKCPRELFAAVNLNLQDPDIQHKMRALAAGFEILTIAAAKDYGEQSIPEQAKQIIQKNYASKDLDVGKLAELMHIHRVTLSRVFAAAYGVSPGKYLTLIRIHAAMQMLKNTKHSIKEVSELCGFNSASYFTKLFIAHTGRPPKHFRDKP